MDQKLITYLKNHKINYTLHEHPAVFTVAESKELNKTIPGLHCKCLFLKDHTAHFYLVAMPADKRLDMKQLRKELAVKKLYFASETELKEHLNVTPGSVSIFASIYIGDKTTTLLVDKTVWDAELTGFHPNRNTATLEIRHEDLKRFYDLLQCDKRIMEL